MPPELILEIAKYLNICNLKALSQLNFYFRNILGMKIFNFPRFRRQISLKTINTLPITVLDAGDIRVMSTDFGPRIKTVILNSRKILLSPEFIMLYPIYYTVPKIDSF